MSSIAKSVAAQERLVDRDGRLRAFPDSYCDKKDVARHVARNINAGNTAFLRIWDQSPRPLRHSACSQDSSISRMPDGSRSKRTSRPGARSGPLSNMIFVSSPSVPSRDRMGSERNGMLYSSSFRIAFALTSVPSLQATTSGNPVLHHDGKLRALIALAIRRLPASLHIQSHRSKDNDGRKSRREVRCPQVQEARQRAPSREESSMRCLPCRPRKKIQTRPPAGAMSVTLVPRTETELYRVSSCRALRPGMRREIGLPVRAGHESPGSSDCADVLRHRARPCGGTFPG